MNVNEKLWKEYKNSKKPNKTEESLGDTILSIFETTLLEQDALSEISGFLGAVVNAIHSLGNSRSFA